MKIVAEVRFNGKNKGTVFDAKDADAEKWIDMGIARKASKKDLEGPPEDKKADKDGAVTK
nr:hypothetical protein 7 [bacterium]